MKGPRELKRYVAKHHEHLKRCHWDDTLIFKMDRCKKWYNRNQTKIIHDWEIDDECTTTDPDQDYN